jgi:UDP-N-acetylglucosamine--N-acetylmuramyl-(pentapeptide) pyrophosphoryl-undecaprenol N-acetylglucosamine transferase
VPALAVADALSAAGADVSFIGTRERAEAELVPAAGFEIDFVRLRGLDRRNPVRAAGAIGLALAAVPRARGILRRRGADAVVGGGGYVAGPAGLAAISLGLPLVLTEADSHLGLTNRLLAERARRVCLAFAVPDRNGPRYLVTGRPVPRAVVEADRATARESLGVGAGERCVLVFGGSLGARSINLAAAEGLRSLGPGRSVIHVAGVRDFESIREIVGGAEEGSYRVLSYLPHLGDVLAASDLVVSRSGGSVFEIAAAGRPAVLVPYPYATAGHQDANARWMEDAGAAIVIDDADLDAAGLHRAVDELLADDERLANMAAASRRIAMPDAAGAVAAAVMETIA